MREILFRGMRTDNGEWVDGHFYTQVYLPETIEEEWYWFIKPIWGRSWQYFRVDPRSVGQYTGLTDKNGKKIFEGDMCRVTRPCVLAYGKITFQNGCFWFVDDGEGGMLRLCDVKINGFQIEVIGNIHDNPELMEESV